MFLFSDSRRSDRANFKIYHNYMHQDLNLFGIADYGDTLFAVQPGLFISKRDAFFAINMMINVFNLIINKGLNFS